MPLLDRVPACSRIFQSRLSSRTGSCGRVRRRSTEWSILAGAARRPERSTPRPSSGRPRRRSRAARSADQFIDRPYAHPGHDLPQVLLGHEEEDSDDVLGLPLKRLRSSGSRVAMPTGQVLRWQARIMMQPEAISGAVEKPISSAPRMAATTTSRRSSADRRSDDDPPRGAIRVCCWVSPADLRGSRPTGPRKAVTPVPPSRPGDQHGRHLPWQRRPRPCRRRPSGNQLDRNRGRVRQQQRSRG